MICVLPSPVEEAIPFTGACGMCGGPDSRHRTLDTIKERFDAGELVTDLVYDYGLSSDVILYIVRHYDVRTGTWSLVAASHDSRPEA